MSFFDSATLGFGFGICGVGAFALAFACGHGVMRADVSDGKAIYVEGKEYRCRLAPVVHKGDE